MHYYGEVLRMEDDHTLINVLELEDKREKSWPKRTWRRQI